MEQCPQIIGWLPGSQAGVLRRTEEGPWAADKQLLGKSERQQASVEAYKEALISGRREQMWQSDRVKIRVAQISLNAQPR